MRWRIVNFGRLVCVHSNEVYINPPALPLFFSLSTCTTCAFYPKNKCYLEHMSWLCLCLFSKTYAIAPSCCALPPHPPKSHHQKTLAFFSYVFCPARLSKRYETRSMCFLLSVHAPSKKPSQATHVLRSRFPTQNYEKYLDGWARLLSFHLSSPPPFSLKFEMKSVYCRLCLPTHQNSQHQKNLVFFSYVSSPRLSKCHQEHPMSLLCSFHSPSEKNETKRPHVLRSRLPTRGILRYLFCSIKNRTR